MKRLFVTLLIIYSIASNAQRAVFGSHNNEVTRSVQSALATPIITNGLIQNLDANNSISYNGAGSTWYDLAGSNNGTIIGGTYTTSGGVAYFNFPTAYVASYVYAPLAKTTSMTFNVWAKSNSIPLVSCMLFNAGVSPNGPDLFFENTSINWNIWDGETTIFKNISSVNLNSTSLVGNTNWHNYTIVVDASANNTKLYFDGVLQELQVIGHQLEILQQHCI